MSGSDKGKESRALDLIRTELGLPPLSQIGVPDGTVPPAGSTAVTFYVGDAEITVWVPEPAKPVYRQKFTEAARRETRRAAEAGNAANTSQLVGGGSGIAIAAPGLIALLSATGPVSIALLAVTVAGVIMAGAGFLAGHWMNKKKFAHEETADRLLEYAEVMK